MVRLPFFGPVLRTLLKIALNIWCLNNIFVRHVIFEHPHGRQMIWQNLTPSILNVQHFKFAMHDLRFIKCVDNKGN